MKLIYDGPHDEITVERIAAKRGGPAVDLPADVARDLLATGNWRKPASRRRRNGGRRRSAGSGQQAAADARRPTEPAEAPAER